jgi:ketosteroid isomerase-like protein
MSDSKGFTMTDSAAGDVTAEVVRRFNAAFQHKDAAAIRDLVAPNCIMEAMQPAPDGLRVEGYEANVAFWEAMVADPNGFFEVEDVVVAADRATIRWRYRFGADAGNSLRGVTLVRVLDGRIAEALAYAKTPVVADLGQATPQTTSEVIRRYNDVFQQHDASGLRELIAEDCVIENTTPAPNGSRHVGRDACLELWQRIATTPGICFDIEDVEVLGERATIRWRLRWGNGGGSVRGVNLMRVRNGQIVEALGYVKGA